MPSPDWWAGRAGGVGAYGGAEWAVHRLESLPGRNWGSHQQLWGWEGSWSRERREYRWMREVLGTCAWALGT